MSTRNLVCRLCDKPNKFANSHSIPRSFFLKLKRPFKSKRLTIGAVDDVAGFRRLVADSPSGGREFSDSIDGKIGQARQHRAQIVANCEAEATTSFHNRKNGGYSWSSLLTSEVDPILAS